MTAEDVPDWRRSLPEQEDSLFDGIAEPPGGSDYRVLTYEVTGRLNVMRAIRPVTS